MGLIGKVVKEMIGASRNTNSIQDCGTSSGYRFTSDWFSGREGFWREILLQLKPRKLLEIGSYEAMPLS